jgi:Mrp family chromosome partitioning ATPase
MADSSSKHIDTRPWDLAVTRALSFAEEQNARIVGVTGHQRCCGVSLLSRELAHAYARHGISAVFVDASRLDLTAVSSHEDPVGSIDLRELVVRQNEKLSVIDLAGSGHLLPRNRSMVRQLLEALTIDDVAVVIDLPPVHSPDAGVQVLRHVGSACSLVYLMCLSGVITKPQLSECVESCKINRVPIQGIIVNDWKEPASWLATTS